MKKIILISLLAISHLTFAQETLKPQLGNKPDISKNAQAHYKALKTKYEVILKKQKRGKLNAADNQWLQDNEMKVVDGNPFSTLLELDPDSWGDIAYIKEVTSSSHLKASANTTYEISNTRDYDLRTAWATNTNNGIDQILTFVFNPIEGIKVDHIKIYNGYQKSEKTWQNNSRAKTIEVRLSGEPAYILELEDTIKIQRFQIKEWPLDVDKNLTMEFRILEIYPGEKYQDLSISEIDFGGTSH